MDKFEDGDEVIYFSEPVNSPRAGVCGYDGTAEDILFMKHKKTKKRKNINKPVKLDNDLSFLDKLMSGKLAGEEANIDINEILSSFKNMAAQNMHSYLHFTIDSKKLKSETLREYLIQLRKFELDEIRKYHNINCSSGLKKDALVERLCEYL